MKIKKRTLRILAALAIIVIVLLLPRLLLKKEPQYTFSDGKFSYSSERGRPQFTIGKTLETENYTLTELSLESRDATLSAYQLRPHAATKGGILLMAGAGVDKKGQLPFAQMLVNEGYEVLLYDQRGTGSAIVKETTAEPEQHKAVYDALAAFDYLREEEKIPHVIVVGESMGGRTAIIAAAMDKSIAAVIGISTSGYGLVTDPMYASINPDNYLAQLGGRKLAMIHSTADTVIPISLAQQTFSLAQQPKKFYQIDGCTHGYCPDMKESVIKALNWIES